MSDMFEDTSIERQALKDFTEQAYLNYSMYVINDRALPHIGDGLKPVQRRIIYAMSQLGLDAAAKYMKSARTIGDVIGKYHPHGDSASYEAMVLMAQRFSYRYPLVDGQGNWGSPDDPKSFAAMRYTESKLTAYAEVLLQEVNLGTVDWVPNFDGVLEEPEVLPARLPNILLNGASGIAVGMATDIPPHNLREVASACIRLLTSPRSTVRDLHEHIKGPDFPTDAEIISSAEDIQQIYESGKGSIRARAVYVEENGDIVITALPYQVSGTRILEQIAAQMQNRKLPMVVDLRDESDHENPTRLVIVPRSNRVDKQALMAHLFATTDMERTYRVNFNLIGIDGRPRVKNLKEVLSEWIQFRTDTLYKRLQHRLDRVVDRLHVLDGLLIAFLNIDEVIKIIREEDNPRSQLMQRFELSERQADSILDIRLRQLARLEEIRIKSEQESLAAERLGLEKTMSSPTRMKTLLKKEITADAEIYGDERRSALVVRSEAKAFSERDLISTEPVTVILSTKGWVRAGKGHDLDPRELTYRSGDEFKLAAHGRSSEDVVFLDSSGRAYTLPIHGLPSARGQGEPLTSKVSPASGATFEGLALGDDQQTYVLASSHGYGFVTRLGDMKTKNKSGKAVLTASKGSSLVAAVKFESSPDSCVAVFTSDGYLLVFPVSELPQLARGKGIKLINIPKAKLLDGSESMDHLFVVGASDTLIVYSGKRHLSLRMKELDHYKGERARRGRKLPRGFQKIDEVKLE